MSGTDLTCCPVCSSQYEQEGDRIPLLLCCTHSVCRRCTRKKLLRKGKSFDCPTCSEENSAPDGVDSIPQNTYVLHILNMSKTPEEPLPKEKCKLHKKRKSLFCNNCESLVCCACVKDEKFCRDHDFGDPEEMKKQRVDDFKKTLVDLKKKIITNREKLVEVMVNENDNCNECLREVNANREEQIRRLNEKAAKLTQNIVDQKTNLNTKCGDAISKLDENVVFLDQMEAKKFDSNKDISDALAKISSVKSQAGSVFAEIKPYEHVTFKKCQTPNKAAKSLCGEVKELQRRIKFSKIGEKAASKKKKEKQANESEESESNEILETEDQVIENQDEADLSGKKLNSLNRTASSSFGPSPTGRRSQVPAGPSRDGLASLHLRRPVTPNSEENQPSSKRARTETPTSPDNTTSAGIVTCKDYSKVFMMTLLGDSVVLYGEVMRGKPLKEKLTQYNLETGAVLFESYFECCHGMTVVKLAGKLCLALSGWKKRRIDFYNATNLRELVFSHFLTDNQPGRLCAVSEHILLFIEVRMGQSVFRSVDCEESRPKYGKINLIPPLQNDRGIKTDVLFTSTTGKGMIIASRGPRGIIAYCTASGEVVWSKQGYLSENDQVFDARGIALDASGHIYVCDFVNDCLQMFNTDGVYLGAFLKNEGLKGPTQIRWYQKTSSLVIVHWGNAICTVSMYGVVDGPRHN